MPTTWPRPQPESRPAFNGSAPSRGAGKRTKVTILPDAKLYIDGKVREAAGGKTYDVLGPWTGEVVTKAADASQADVEEAIAAARRAFDETDWSTNHDKRLTLVKK